MNTPKGESVVSVFSQDCPSRELLLDVTGRWGALVLAALHREACRFSVLRRRVEGVSERMLSQTLQALRRDGLVERAVEGTIPPRVTYSLSPLGIRVAGRIAGLVELLEEETDQFQEARKAFDGVTPATAPRVVESSATGITTRQESYP
ncbi:winged helix-turn-helix transcriptional regulator [Streptomyces sp. NPDC001530]|uniref:winged helix-turn-helix transcriptional regulator n=1 Tax=Streptomyces sp. NPDC001530 TaxID=3364582 RepID=UPI0036C5D1D2